MRIEQIGRFGPVARNWLLELYNTCKDTISIPKLWRRSHVVAILKPGKEASDAKSYRHISLLCHTFKIFERLILERIKTTLEEVLIEQQAGFRPGKSCTSQILNLTQHIEDGFERAEVTGAAFVDLTAAYDTVNQRRLIVKLYNMTKDFHLSQVVSEILSNRRYRVSFQGKTSRWRTQKTAFPRAVYWRRSYLMFTRTTNPPSPTSNISCLRTISH